MLLFFSITRQEKIDLTAINFEKLCSYNQLINLHFYSMIQTVNKNNYGDDMTELNILFQIFNNLSESEKKAFLRKVKILQYNLSLELSVKLCLLQIPAYS